MLGVTPLDFGHQSCVDALKENLEQYGWEVLSSWAMGDTLETLARAREAAVNLVVSSVGLRAAQVLQEKFGTPYVVGAPVAGYANVISKVLEHTLEIGRRDELPTTENASQDLRGKCCESVDMSKHFRDETIIDAERKELNASRISAKIPYLHHLSTSKPEITLIGEPVLMGSLAAAIERLMVVPYRCFVRSKNQKACYLEKTSLYRERKPWKSTERREDHCCRSAV